MDISTPRSNLVVRFLSVFLLCCTSLYASGDQTGKQKITVIASDVTLETVFKQIEKQTGLRFMYAVDAVDVKEKVTVMFEKVMLDDVLESLLGKKGIEWVYREGVISLKQQGKPFDVGYRSNFVHPPMTVKGRVIDLKGNPIPFATVSVKGGRKGTKTDIDGIFSLKNIEANAILTISSIGFEKKEVPVNSENVVIRMAQEIGRLGETVVKGYYATTGIFNTGNITTVRSTDIEQQPVSDVLLTLQGRVPGLTISQTTGLSGGKINIQIRGQNSFNSGTRPLFIVDGVPYESSITAPLGGSYGALSNIISTLNFLSPSDIDRIDILKDADATAIYGSRGANGVILITTKKGKTGVMRVNVNINRGWQKVARRVDLLSTKDYLALRREAFINDNEEPTIQSAPDLLAWDTTRYTDWQKELVGGASSYTDAQTSISSGNTTVQYLLGGNFHRETTPFPGNFYSQRVGAHFSLTGNAFDQKLRTSLNASYSINNINYPQVDFSSDILLPPNAPAIYTQEGKLNWENSTWENPHKKLISSMLEAENNNMVVNIEASYELKKGLIFKANIGYNELRSNTFAGTTIAGVDPAYRNTATASANYLNSKIKSWISEPQISYNSQLLNGSLEALAGMTFLGNVNDGLSLHTHGIADDALIRFPAAATSYSAYGNGSKYKYMAVFGRIGYNLMNRYLLNVTMRRDGSSRFGSDRRFATFGAIGVGWIFSEENFFNKYLTFITYGKLRGSYGITGNDQIGDYQYLDRYEFLPQTYQGIKGVKAVGLFNPDFSWEKTRKSEIGLELGLFKDKVFISASYYSTFSNNQIINYLLPSITGAAAVMGNMPAAIRNKGIEFILTTQNIKSSNFLWTSSLNVSRNENKIVSIEGFNKSFALEVGQSLSTRYLTEVAGVDPLTGNYLFFDSNGKPVSEYYLADFRRKRINLSPAFSGGFQNTFRYKSLQLDIFFQFVKQKGLDGRFSSFVPGQIKNMSTAVSERWRAPGDVAILQRASQNYSLYDSYFTWLYSDQAFVNASFIRCKNLMLSWQVPKLWAKKVYSNDTRIYIQCQNLFTVTKYPGWDPENQSLESLPPLRVITAGFNIGF